jgi:AcrR family transcriptional regulator
VISLPDSDLELPEPTSDGGPPGDEPSLTDLHLWKLPRGRHGLPRELVAQSQRERLLAAVVRVTATKGYQASSVADVLKEAGVGRETFYRHFKDKEDCFVAANDALVTSLAEQIAAAYEEPQAWPARVRRGLAATLEWLSVNPDVARVMMVETGCVGPQAAARFHETFQRFAHLLDEGSKLVDDVPALPNIAVIAGGAAFARVYEEVALGHADELPGLLPQITFEVLLPYVGEATALEEREAAEAELGEGDGDR